MDLSRQVTIALTVCGAMAFTACQVLLVLDDKDGPTPLDAGQVDGVSNDGPVSDAPAPDATSSNDASLGDANPRLLRCASDDAAAFCSNFDEPNPLAAWSSADPGVEIVDGGVSAPFQARMHSIPSKPCQPWLHAEFPGRTSRFDVTAQIRTDSVQSSFVMVKFKSSPLEIMVGLDAAGPYVYQKNGVDAPVTARGKWSDDAAPNGVTSSAELELTITQQPVNGAEIRARVGDATIVAVLKQQLVLEDISIHFGPQCALVDANVWLDDVVVWLDP